MKKRTVRYVRRVYRPKWLAGEVGETKELPAGDAERLIREKYVVPAKTEERKRDSHGGTNPVSPRQGAGTSEGAGVDATGGD